MNELYRRTNVTNKLQGSYQAQVVNVEHPDGLYMASIRLLGLWDAISDDDLPYAEFLLPLGAKPSAGHAIPVEPGDYVWVDFPRNGDSRYPRITGSLYYAPNHESNLPDEINGKAYTPKRSAGEPTPPAYNLKDDLYQRFGLREHKTSKGGWSITHVATGTAIEITENGQLVVHAEGDQFQSATGKQTTQCGELTIQVKGNAKVESQGEVSVTASGSASIDAASIEIKSKGDVNINAGGQFAVKAKAAPFTLG